MLAISASSRPVTIRGSGESASIQVSSDEALLSAIAAGDRR